MHCKNILSSNYIPILFMFLLIYRECIRGQQPQFHSWTTTTKKNGYATGEERWKILLLTSCWFYVSFECYSWCLNLSLGYIWNHQQVTGVGCSLEFLSCYDESYRSEKWQSMLSAFQNEKKKKNPEPVIRHVAKSIEVSFCTVIYLLA